ncbi:hypothetical protein GCM10011338_42260 [Alteromonas lipolytica]|nr:hypothetical protein GCM10011338_42260 [Alteromonas lipolytica]
MSASDLANDIAETKKRACIFGRKKNVEGYSKNIEPQLKSINNSGLATSFRNKIFYNK